MCSLDLKKHCLIGINKPKRNNPIFAYLDKNNPIPQEAQRAYAVMYVKGLYTLSRKTWPSKSSQEKSDTVHKSVPQHL